MTVMLDGNAEQVRAISDQLAEAIERRRGGLSPDDVIEKLNARIDEKVSAAETRLKYWVVVAVLTQLVAMLPIIFFLGGIYSTNNTSLSILQRQQAMLEKRGQWMQQRERWEQSVESWATPKGFAPPRYRDETP